MISFETGLLICAALFPAIALCVYVFKKDRVEKEPAGLLTLLFFLGAVICFPTAYTEAFLSPLIDSLFIPFAEEGADAYYLDGGFYSIYNAVDNFIGIALVEEGFKFLVLFFVTRNNKNFNCFFDGLIYSVFVSLGFAAFENVLYVLDYGWGTAVTRALMSVPGHMFFSVIMGYYYSLWNVYRRARSLERNYKAQGLIKEALPEFNGKKYIVLALLISTLGHGWYDYCCNSDSSWSTVPLLAFVAFLYFYCFGKIKKMSAADADSMVYSVSMMMKKYPYLYEIDTEEFCDTVDEGVEDMIEDILEDIDDGDNDSSDRAKKLETEESPFEDGKVVTEVEFTGYYSENAEASPLQSETEDTVHS